MAQPWYCVTLDLIDSLLTELADGKIRGKKENSDLAITATVTISYLLKVLAGSVITAAEWKEVKSRLVQQKSRAFTLRPFAPGIVKEIDRLVVSSST